MTREQVKSPNGVSFMLDYDGQLSPQQMQHVLNEIGCSDCGLVTSLGTCTSVQKQATDTAVISAKPAGGKAPYTVKLYKGAPLTGTLLLTVTNVPENTSISPYTYTLTGADVGLSQFSAYVTDSCTPIQNSSDSCNVTVLTNICSWVSNIGVNSIMQTNLITLLGGYQGSQSLGFTVTQAHLIGVLSYYQLNKSGGNSSTGCNFT
jgi:hypothetical protein